VEHHHLQEQQNLWNGTNWTEVNDLNTARRLLAVSGIQTSALAFGGDASPYTGKTELWNGTSWTEQNNLSTARRALGGTKGSNTTACIRFWWSYSCSPSDTAATEEWTGAGAANRCLVYRWNLNTARSIWGLLEHQYSRFIFGGHQVQQQITESYDGTSWTEVNDLNTARHAARWLVQLIQQL
jgi:hypothetical protein